MTNKFESIARLTSSQMRDLILDNPQLFPEYDGISESELIKIVMNDNYKIRHTAGYNRINFKPIYTFIVIVGIVALIALVFTGNLSAEILPAVAGM